MTTAALDICKKLGYPDAGSHDAVSLAQVLLNDLRLFATNKPDWTDPDWMTNMYMLSPVKIFEHAYHWTPDGTRVTELLSQLFREIIPGRVTQARVSTIEVSRFVEQSNGISLTSTGAKPARESTQVFGPSASWTDDGQTKDKFDGDIKEDYPGLLLGGVEAPEVFTQSRETCKEKIEGPANRIAYGQNDQSIDFAEEVFLFTDQNGTIDQVKIKKEPTNSEIRRATLKRKKAERQTRQSRWDSTTPPLSSLETVKKFRWPPQYVSPPPISVPKKQKLSEGKPYTHRNTGGQPLAGAHSRFSSPEVIFEGLVTPPQGIGRSTRSVIATKSKILSPPKTPKKEQVAPRAIFPGLQLQSSQRQSSISASSSTSSVAVHFFLSDENLGAIPLALNECDTSGKFFKQALSAWNLLGQEDRAKDMAAVSVSIEGAQWPMVLRWGSVQAFQRMSAAMDHARSHTTKDLEVKVKCIKS